MKIKGVNRGTIYINRKETLEGLGLSEKAADRVASDPNAVYVMDMLTKGKDNED